MMNQQYQVPQPQQMQQSQQQAPVYSNEPQMQQNQQNQQQLLDTNDITKVECLLDENSLKIISESYPEFAESIINLGIKMVGESDIYKSYMLKNEYKNQAEVIQEAENKQSLSLNSQQTNNIVNDKNKSVSNSSAGFAAW